MDKHAHDSSLIPCVRAIAEVTCPTERCHYLKLRPSRWNWLATRLAIRAADAVLAMPGRPDRLAKILLSVMRGLSGMVRCDVATPQLSWPYLDGGRGQVVVLVHGYGADKDRFGSLVPFLRRRYRVVIPDLPGFGDHHKVGALQYDIMSLVLQFDDFIKALGLKRFHLMGLSLGGYVAALYAARFPQKTKSLALMGSAGISSPCDSDAWTMFRQSGSNIFLYTTAREVETLIDYLIHRPLKLPKHVLRYWAELGREHRDWRQKLIEDLIAGGLSLLDDWAPKIQAPTLLLWGADDRICHVSAVGRFLQLIPDSRAYVFDSCGHIPLYEYPKAFQQIYGRFLREMTR